MDKSKNIALCIDLDGTLIYSDAFIESILLFLKKYPYLILHIFFWFLKGKVYLKNKIYAKVSIDASSLPYNFELIEYIKEEKNKGRKVYLATASHISVAQSVDTYLNLFDDILATDKKGKNLKSANKRDRLVELFGKGNYDYAGDCSADYKVWDSSNAAIIVSDDLSFINKVKSKYTVAKIFTRKHNKFKLLIKQIRVYQWVKNLLIFLPLFLAHEILNDVKLTNTLIAFFSFSISASFVYVLNDLLDLNSDRKHPNKKNRPLASGRFAIKTGIVLVPILAFIGLLSALYVSINFTIVLTLYIILTTAYSFKFKKEPILDIIILAMLFTSRIIAGSTASEVYLSVWIMAFSMFFFLNLAIIKRYAELLLMKNSNRLKTEGRGYHVEDMSLLQSLGSASAFISVLVIVLYINSEQSLNLYSQSNILWLIAPLLLYWIIRLWHITVRGKMTDDPIIFTGKDKVSYIIFLAIFILVYIAK